MPSPTYTYRGNTFADRKGADCKLIRITDNGETKKYKSVDDVPAELRDEVKGIIRYSENHGLPAPEKKID